MNFFKNYAHDIMCWSWALGICGLLFIVMMLIDYAWNSAYKKGYGDCLKDNGLTTE